uniref:Uncharacterized protein n=2 Tax=viral metagenome TaxID=1070528 RepID=A0A6M3LJC8_9ZZZZ
MRQEIIEILKRNHNIVGTPYLFNEMVDEILTVIHKEMTDSIVETVQRLIKEEK